MQSDEYTNRKIQEIMGKLTIVNGCWERKDLYHDEDGYTSVWFKNKRMRSHRLMFLYFREEIKEGNVIDHLCRNRGCCNPQHLRQVTPRINTLENSISVYALNSKKTHCPQGHAYSPENTRFTDERKAFHRRCIECHKAHARRSMAKHRAKVGYDPVKRHEDYLKYKGRY